MISDDEVGDALRYLANPKQLADAVFEEARLGELIKNFRAELMRASKEKTQAGKEAEAMAHPEYRALTEKQYPDAKARVAYHKAKYKWAETAISIYQTRARMQREAEKVR